MHALPSRPPSTLLNAIHRDQVDTLSPAGAPTKPRSTVLLRVWDNMEWTTDLKQYIRSVIMELSLLTGAEYEVFLLVHVKNNEIQTDPNDEKAVRRLKESFVPAGFRDMAVLFNDKTLEAWYPEIEEHR